MIGRQADWQTGRQADRQTGIQADRQAGRRAGRQTGRQADKIDMDEETSALASFFGCKCVGNRISVICKSLQLKSPSNMLDDLWGTPMTSETSMKNVYLIFQWIINGISMDYGLSSFSLLKCLFEQFQNPKIDFPVDSQVSFATLSRPVF